MWRIGDYDEPQVLICGWAVQSANRADAERWPGVGSAPSSEPQLVAVLVSPSQTQRRLHLCRKRVKAPKASSYLAQPTWSRRKRSMHVLTEAFTPEPYGQPDATHLVHDGPTRPALPWWHRSMPVQVSMQSERAFGLTRICRGAVNQGQCAGVHPAGARLWARLHGTPRHLPQQGMSRSGRGVELNLHCGVWTA